MRNKVVREVDKIIPYVNPLRNTAPLDKALMECPVGLVAIMFAIVASCGGKNYHNVVSGFEFFWRRLAIVVSQCPDIQLRIGLLQLFSHLVHKGDDGS